MKRTLIKTAAALAVAMAITVSGTTLALAGEAGDKANSWRYANGQPISQSAQSNSKDDSSTLSATSLMASSSKVKNCWEKSYGTTMMYDVESGNGKTAIKGAREVAIDVSEHNGKIDWKKVASDGITSAIVRCGYGSNFPGQDDKYWLANIKGAKKAGLKVGVYLYSYAQNVTGSNSSAESEGLHVLRCLNEAGLTADDLDLPIYYDLEEYTQSKYEGSKLEAMCLQFAKPLEAAGYKIGVYAGSRWFETKFNSDSFKAQNWSKWIPHYNDHCMYCTKSNGAPDTIANYGKYLDIWQFGSCGKVNGISTNVDMNFIFNDIQTSKVRYVLSGGINNESNPTNYTAGSSAIALGNPTRAGYKFQGWYTTGDFKASSKAAAIDCSVDAKQTFYAKWSPITYKITYKTNKGTLPSGYVKAFTVETSTFSLPTPGRKGYGFVGWYTNSACTKKASTKISLGSTGNRTFYAKWVKGKYTAKVTASSLTIRQKASVNSKAKGSLAKGTVVGFSKLNKNGTWGYIAKKGWVKLKYAPLRSYYAKVTASQLTVRKGAGTGYGATSSLKKNAKVWISHKSGSWGYIPGKGWISVKYVKRA